jgi:hypothetical protein
VVPLVDVGSGGHVLVVLKWWLSMVSDDLRPDDELSMYPNTCY